MGEMAVPPPHEREKTLSLANEIKLAVEEDNEGPLALPDLERVKKTRDQIALLKQWWTDTDNKISRLAQDLIDTRAALEISCALLAARDIEIGRTSFAHRLRVLDIPSQEELDAPHAPHAPPPTDDVPADAPTEPEPESDPV